MGKNDELEKLNKMLERLLNDDVKGMMDFIEKSRVGTEIHAKYGEGGEISMNLIGSYPNITFMLAVIIEAHIKQSKNNKTFDEYIADIRRHYDFLERFTTRKYISCESDEMRDVISKLIKNPEKMDEIKRTMKNDESKDAT